jgi:hypothetical protein
MSPRVKGRYSPLTSLLPRVGARWLLQQESNLVNQALTAMQDDMVANTATTFFKALLSTLRQEVNSSTGDAAGAVGETGTVNPVNQGSDMLTAWCQWWLDPLLAVLWGSDDRQRTYVANHALPAVLQLEPALLQPLVNRVLAAAGSTPGQPPVNATAALVVVLKAARQLMLIGDLDALTKLTGSTPESAQSAAEGGASQQQQQREGGLLGGGARPLVLLLGAITGDSESLRCDTLELACVNPR